MIQSAPSKQKQQALLIGTYKRAMALLQRPATEAEGRSLLEGILHDDALADSTLKQLKLSTLLSLAEISRLRGEQGHALGYWYLANQIESSLNTWVKMAQTLQQISQQIGNTGVDQMGAGLAAVQDQIQFCYKHAIHHSPLSWRRTLMQRLHHFYAQHGKSIQAQDLSAIMQDEQCDRLVDQIVASSQDPDTITDFSVDKILSPASKEAIPILSVNLFHFLSADGGSNEMFYDFLLAICYALMGMCYSSKKYLKKHEDVIKSLERFDIFKTRIVLRSKGPETGCEAGMQPENESPDHALRNAEELRVHTSFSGQMQEQQKDSYKISLQICSQIVEKSLQLKVGQQKKRPQIDRLCALVMQIEKDVVRDPSIAQAKSKKNHITITNNSKVVFQSLADYMREVSSTKGVKTQLLRALRYLEIGAVEPNKQTSSIYQQTLGSLTDSIERVCREKEKQKQVLMKDLPGNDPEGGQASQNSLTRERRSTVAISIQPPSAAMVGVKAKFAEGNRLQQHIQAKIREEFTSWLSSGQCPAFANILQLCQQTVTRLLTVFARQKVHSMTDSDNLQVVPGAPFLRNTTKLLALCACRLAEWTDYLWELPPAESTLCLFLLARHLEEEAGTTPPTKGVSVYYALVDLCSHKIDSIIYRSSCGTLGRKYSQEDLKELLTLLVSGVMLATGAYGVDEPRANMYCTYYQQLYQLYGSQDSNYELQKLPFMSPDKLKQAAQIRAGKSKLRELSQQQCEESVLVASLDRLLKSDMKTAEALQSIKNIMNISHTGSISFYLTSFSKIVEVLFHNLENSNGFNSKFVQNTLKVMEIPSQIQILHRKLNDDKKGARADSSDPPDHNLRILTMYNLIRIYLLNELDQEHSSLCLRIVLYLVEDALRARQEASGNPSLHYLHAEQICKIIVVLESLVKLRESSDLPKKFYQRVLIKNIRYVYTFHQQWSTRHPGLRLEIYRIYNEVFHSKGYKPKKMEDCLGYFLMLSREFAAQFDKHEVQVEQRMKRVFNECFLIFQQGFDNEFKFCERFLRAIQYFVCVMRKKIKEAPEFTNYFTGAEPICECCQAPYLNNDVTKQPFPKEVLFVVAKFIEYRQKQEKSPVTAVRQVVESESIGCKIEVKKVNPIELQEEDEKFYMFYLLLAVRTGKAWYELLRFQISKVYKHFDCLMSPDYSQEPTKGQPTMGTPSPDSVMELYRHKFKYTKMIGSFVIHNLTSVEYSQARQYAIYRTYIANALKIRERKLNKKFAELASDPETSSQATQKYMEGISTILQRNPGNEEAQLGPGSAFTEVNYLAYCQFELPMLVYNCENDIIGIDKKSQIVTKLNLGQKLMSTIMRGREANEKATRMHSAYETSYLVYAIRVQALAALTDMILRCFQSIQHIAVRMQRQAEVTTATKPQYYYGAHQASMTIEDEVKCLKKLDLLSEIEAGITQSQLDLTVWSAPDSRHSNCHDSNMEEQKQSRVSFKYKHIFPDYMQAITNLQCRLEQFLQIYQQISKQKNPNRLKKQNYSRYLFLSDLYASRIRLCVGSAAGLPKQLYNLKSDELVNFYHHYENEPTEPNPILAEFYSRDIVFHYTKIEAIQHLLHLMMAGDGLEAGLGLVRRLGKICFVRLSSEEKEKENPIKDKAHEEAKKNELPIAEPVGQNSNITKPAQVAEGKDKAGEKGKQPKKPKKEAKQKSQKSVKIQRKIKWLFVLYLHGIQIYLDRMVEILNSSQSAFEQKFERPLRQFRNKLRKQVEKEKKIRANQTSMGEIAYSGKLIEQLEGFVNYYESRFDKKIRMKALKKDKGEGNEGDKNGEPNLENNNEQSDNEPPLIQNTHARDEFVEMIIPIKTGLVGQNIEEISDSGIDSEPQRPSRVSAPKDCKQEGMIQVIDLEQEQGSREEQVWPMEEQSDNA